MEPGAAEGEMSFDRYSGTEYRFINTSGSESQGQEEAASMRIQANATTTVSYLHVRSRDKDQENTVVWVTSQDRSGAKTPH